MKTTVAGSGVVIQPLSPPLPMLWTCAAMGYDPWPPASLLRKSNELAVSVPPPDDPTPKDLIDLFKKPKKKEPPATP